MHWTPTDWTNLFVSVWDGLDETEFITSIEFEEHKVQLSFQPSNQHRVAALFFQNRLSKSQSNFMLDAVAELDITFLGAGTTSNKSQKYRVFLFGYHISVFNIFIP